MDFLEAKKERTQEILLLLKAFDDECKSAIDKIESTYRDEIVEEKKSCSFCEGTGYEKGNQCIDLEEKKTLSDKIVKVDTDEFGVTPMTYEKDVKEKIKEFTDWLYSSESEKSSFKQKAKEIFGERLT